MQVCTSLQTDNHANTPPLSFFTGRMPFLPPNQQRQSTEGSPPSANAKVKSVIRRKHFIEHITNGVKRIFSIKITKLQQTLSLYFQSILTQVNLNP